MDGFYYLVVIDAYSKWPEVHRMKDTRAPITISKLRQTFGRWKIPKTLVSDNGPQFTAGEFATFTTRNNIKHVRTPVYHPQSNGQAENFVKTFKSMLKKNIKENKNVEIGLVIDRFLLSYRNTEHSTTKKTPAELFMGRKLRMRLDNVINKGKRVTTQEEVLVSRRKLFEVGEIVLARDYSTVSKSDWMKGRILKKLGRWLFKIESNGRMITRHANQIRSFAEEPGATTSVTLPKDVGVRRGTPTSYQAIGGQGQPVTNTNQTAELEGVAPSTIEEQVSPTIKESSQMEEEVRPRRRAVRMPVRFQDYHL